MRKKQSEATGVLRLLVRTRCTRGWQAGWGFFWGVGGGGLVLNTFLLTGSFIPAVGFTTVLLFSLLLSWVLFLMGVRKQ